LTTRAPNPQVRNPERLRALIEASGKSYAQLGRAMGCSKAMVHQLATGLTPGCRPELAARLAAELEVDKTSIFVFYTDALSSTADNRGITP